MKTLLLSLLLISGSFKVFGQDEILNKRELGSTTHYVKMGTTDTVAFHARWSLEQEKCVHTHTTATYVRFSYGNGDAEGFTLSGYQETENTQSYIVQTSTVDICIEFKFRENGDIEYVYVPEEKLFPEYHYNRVIFFNKPASSRDFDQLVSE